VNQSVFPTSNFKWVNTVLFQEFEIIQHKPNEKRDVGIFHEWRQVLVKGSGVRDDSEEKEIVEWIRHYLKAIDYAFVSPDHAKVFIQELINKV